MMLFTQTVAFFAAYVAIATAAPALGSSQGSPGDALSAIHGVIHHQRSDSLNISRSAPATTSQIPTRFLATARPSKAEPVDGVSVILSRAAKATQPLSTSVSLAKALTAMVKHVQPELADAYFSKVLRAATVEDVARLRPLSTEAGEGRRDSGVMRARRASELALLVPRMKPDGAAREQVGGLGGGKNHSGPVSRAGLTLDPCVSSTDCVGVRECSFFADDMEACNGRTGCLCSIIPPQVCSSSAECVIGEACVLFEELSWCASASFAASMGAPEVSGGPDGSEGGSSDNSVSTGGLSFDICYADSDCKSTRKCLEGGKFPCNGSTKCSCIKSPPDECDSSDSCYSGEVCVLTFDDTGPWCVSPTAAKQFVYDGGTILTDGSESTGNSEGDIGNRPPSTEPDDKPPSTDPGDQPQTTESEGEAIEESDEDGGQGQVSIPLDDAGINTGSEDNSSDEGVCVDAKALAHMPDSDLVFERHPRARVLCDAQSSCATPGHMVVFRGEAMMMKSYCRLTSCSKRVMEVNSPRYRRQLLVSSNTDGLKFTAFASRYETRGEEKLMSMAVRMGW